ncbi:MAG: hypothetical protein NT030_00990 [Candidatus Saganbacteria bacterium]|nr:hypothetical protein [Candidatus Saganbacteria bacterium]
MKEPKAIEALNKFFLNKFINNLISIDTSILKLYSVSSYTGSVKTSDPVRLIVIDDLKSVISSIEANFHN